MWCIDPKDPAEPGSLAGVFEVDQDLLGDRPGVFRTEQGVAATMLKPTNDGLILQPRDDHFAIELAQIVFIPGVGDRRTVGDDRCHGIAVDLDATVVPLGREPFPARLRES